MKNATDRPVFGLPSTVMATAFCLFLLVPGLTAVQNTADKGRDSLASELLKLVLETQPDPDTTPSWTYNYGWAETCMAYLAAERNGYLSRKDAIRRLKGILTFAANCERRNGFWYDGYDPKTGKPTNRNVYFQGWWIYSLIVLKNAYPELKSPCETLLAGLDYTGMKDTAGSGRMYNPETKQVSADIKPDGTVSYERAFFNQEAGEGRTSYVAYSYVTGDIEPFLFGREPDMQTVEGMDFFQIWEHQNFEYPFLHYEFHDVGYYDKAYKNWQEATRRYMKRCGMKLVPIREWFLYETWPDNGFPCCEHRESMSFTTWAVDPEAPVRKMAWVPGIGLTRYYDNWNFYWSACGRLRGSGVRLLKNNRLVFPVRIKPELKGGDPARLDIIRFPFVPSGNPPPLVISFNRKPVARIVPPAQKGPDSWTVSITSNYPGAQGKVSSSVPADWCGRSDLFDTNVPVPPKTLWAEISGIRGLPIMGINNIELKLEPSPSSGTYLMLNYDKSIVPINVMKMLGTGTLDLAGTRDGWISGADANAECALTGKACPEFNYTFSGAPQWAQAGKTGLMLDLSKSPDLKLDYDLTGPVTEMEVKLIDADGSTFIDRFETENGPHSLVLTPGNFQYGWGGTDSGLDRSHITEIWITVVGHRSGSGNLRITKLALSDVELVETYTETAPAMEIMVNGQREGTENAFALLARIMAVHDYRVCDELVNDERYRESMVAWVGSYTNRVELARWVHNLSDEPIQTEYVLPDRVAPGSVKVTVRKTGIEIPVRISGNIATWTIPARQTHHISLKQVK